MNQDLLKDSLQSILSQFGDFALKLLAALAIFIIGYIIAKFVYKAIIKILESVGIDKLADKLKEIDFIEKSKVKIIPSKIIAKVIYYVIMLIVLVAASSAVGLEVISEQIAKVIDYIPKLFIAFILLIIGLIASNMVKKLIHATLKSFGVSSAKMLSEFAFIFLLINVLLTALAQAEFDMTFIGNNIMLVIGGLILAMAIGYGLAAKPIAANIISSYYSGKKIQLGDTIKIRGHVGTIIDKDNTSFTIKTNSEKIIFPLGILTSEEFHLL